MLLLLQLICRPFSSKKVWQVSLRCCMPSLVVDIRTRSLANSSPEIGWPSNRIPKFECSRRVPRSAMKRANRMGDKGQPYFRPLCG
jgi:hypothetical protein